MKIRSEHNFSKTVVGTIIKTELSNAQKGKESTKWKGKTKNKNSY